MQQLRGKDLALVGFTLFSMFFGAGNLIFPPFLGAQAGANTWPAMAGFLTSAVGLPILGVVAVARAGGLDKLAGRVHPRFAAVFTLLIYLSIGPCVAIPRTASTSFEMAVAPFYTGATASFWPIFLYSAVFFAVAFLLALRPDKLTDRLGKVLCPALLVLILVVFFGCILHPIGSYGAPAAIYTGHTAVRGFLDGYQTMDAIAALNFGIVISLNIRARGVTDETAAQRGTIHAGLIAGALFLVIYSMLAHVGALSGGAFPGAANGAETLTRLVSALFGSWGSVLLAAIFVIACLNTCVGLISCCSTYFGSLLPRVPYPAWAAFFALVSLGISLFGLSRILVFSLPVLSALYPAAIVLIALSFADRLLAGRRFVYPVTMAFTCVPSVLFALSEAGLRLPLLSDLLDRLPLASLGLGWLLPAVLGLALGLLVSSPPRKAS